ncbi:hypothetical protein CTAYLR_008851 [Chrysophaeum taylorii]|uniref:Helicase n=1 Tax=Chrysophaeum taylorii TaxID=2483200 RepID=A0AAD7UQT8_9STRA|nr:hypothetical protein CTAYLR_008851 [Chrysophaeum taylorii]
MRCGVLVRRFLCTPRPHQAAAIEAVVSHARGGATRATVVLPGGAGKTLVGARVVASLAKSIGVVVVPTLALVDQTLREYRRWSPELLDTTLVVASRAAGDVLRTTSVDALREALSSSGEEKRLLLIVSTYRSLPKLVEALARSRRTVDIAVLDEAHVTTYVTRKHKPSGYGAAVSDEFRARFRLFMTATPRIATRVPMADRSRHSMDDKTSYGEVVFEMSREAAAASGVTVPLQVVVVDSPRVADKQADDVEIALVLKRIYDDYGVSRALCFLNRTVRVKAFTAAAGVVFKVVDRPEVKTTYVEGGMSPEEREGILRVVRESNSAVEKHLLTNARLLATGVDVPSIDAVVVAEPRRSHLDIAQMAARAARAAPGKTRGLVVVPVRATRRRRRRRTHNPDDDDEEEEEDEEITMDDVDESDFGTVLAVLRAVGDAEDWRAVIRDDGLVLPGVSSDDQNEPKKEPRIIVDAKVPGMAKALDDLVRAAVLRLTSKWDERYEGLVRFHAQYGHCMVPFAYMEENRLGSWVSRQRVDFKQGKLMPDQVAKLDALGMVWDTKAAQWQLNLEDWQAYTEAKRKNPRVARSTRLGSWVRNQNRRFADGMILPERLKELRRVGFETKKPKSRPKAPRFYDIFDAGLAAYENHKRAHGHVPTRCKVPIVYDDDDDDDDRKARPVVVDLGKWVRRVRIDYKAGRLDAEKLRSLEAVGFVFDERARVFDQRIAELCDFRRAADGCRTYPLRHSKLGEWLHCIERGGTAMTPDRIRKLHVECGVEVVHDPALKSATFSRRDSWFVIRSPAVPPGVVATAATSATTDDEVVSSSS